MQAGPVRKFVFALILGMLEVQQAAQDTSGLYPSCLVTMLSPGHVALAQSKGYLPPTDS